jgi:hypothetical protein
LGLLVGSFRSIYELVYVIEPCQLSHRFGEINPAYTLPSSQATDQAKLFTYLTGN